MIPYFKSSDRAFTLLHGDCIELLKQFSFKFDMIFADPPYFLSNGGISVQSGKMVCVDKGEWDKGGGQRPIRHLIFHVVILHTQQSSLFGHASLLK